MKFVQNVVWIVICVLSGMLGAYLVLHIGSPRSPGTLQTQRLELIDRTGRVRATFSVDDGQVALRMLSTESQPIVSLTVDQDRGPSKYASGAIAINDGSGRPLVMLHSLGQDRAQLAIAGPSGSDQISLGYAPYGDVTDEHERGMWGLRVRGPNHSYSGMNVFSEDGVLKGFNIPLAPPPPLPKGN